MRWTVFGGRGGLGGRVRRAVRVWRARRARRAGRAAAMVAVAALIGIGGAGAQREIYPSARHGGTYMFNYYLPPSPITTPWAPAWRPDGAAIAVSMAGSIWEVDPVSGAATELTHDGRYHSSPDWSPDGRWVVFTADHDLETIQLAVLNVETGDVLDLTDDEFLYLDPTFSPDGTRLAYVSNKPNGYFNVYIRSITNGEWSGAEVAVSSDRRYPSSRLYFGEWDMHLTPTWMPDGRELLLVSNRDVPLGSGNVVRVPAESGGIARGTTVLREQTLYRTRPHVSIDGKRFIYSSTRGAADQYSNLWLQPTVGGEPYKLTFFEHDAFHPRWSPDGEWIAYVSNARGLPHLALLETYGGARRDVPITTRRWKNPTGTLSVRIVEAETGRRTPARLLVTAADGKAYAPADTYARVGFTRDHLFHTTGEFTLDLPAGPATITAIRGFETWPDSTEVTITPGEVATATLTLPRMTDLRADGWYSGSTHVHMNYAGNLHNTLDNLKAMSAAEDQDVVLEQIANKDNRILDYQYFVPGGGPHPASEPDRLVVVGQEYRPPFYGHVFMFGLRDHLLSPFTTGYEGTAIESLYPSNTDMLRKAIAQGASTGYVHPFYGESDPLETGLGNGKGFLVDAALGTTHHLEWSRASRAGFFPLYAAWDNGLRVTAVGGEDSISDLHIYQVVGAMRTYVHTMDRGLEMSAWFEQARRGRSFVSNGPLLSLTVDDRMPGDEIKLPGGGGTVRLAATARSLAPLRDGSVYFNGNPVGSLEWSGDGRSGRLESSFRVTESGWLHLRVAGAPDEVFPFDAAYAQAFTNPVWIVVGDSPVRSRAAAEYGMRWVDSLRAQAEAWPGWRSDRERRHVFAQFDEARGVYARRAREARR